MVRGGEGQLSAMPGRRCHALSRAPQLCRRGRPRSKVVIRLIMMAYLDPTNLRLGESESRLGEQPQ